VLTGLIRRTAGVRYEGVRTAVQLTSDFDGVATVASALGRVVRTFLGSGQDGRAVSGALGGSDAFAINLPPPQAHPVPTAVN
jgi:hypothetical protein